MLEGVICCALRSVKQWKLSMYSAQPLATLSWAGTRASHAASRRTLPRYRFPSSRLTLNPWPGRVRRDPAPPVGLSHLKFRFPDSRQT